MLAVIGSTALYERNIKLDRPRLDCDIVGDYDELVRFLKDMNCNRIYPIANGKKLVGHGNHIMYDCEIAWPNSTSEELHRLIINDKESLVIDNTCYASLDMCYLLKMTHRFKKNSPHFKKTMNDIKLLRKLGATIPSKYKDFYDRRLKETLSYKHPKLNQSKKDFFTDDVPYQYDHDSIHKAVKLYDYPAYTYFKEDQSEVKVSKKLWNKLPHEIKLAAVYEESCVLALERSQVPYPDTDKFKSFRNGSYEGMHKHYFRMVQGIFLGTL
jgi:hypothetical protein